jgi:hypothetical protein
MNKSEVDKIFKPLQKKDEALVSPLVDLTVKLLKAITDKLNLPEQQAFYRLLLKRPEIEQYNTWNIS